MKNSKKQKLPLKSTAFIFKLIRRKDPLKQSMRNSQSVFAYMLKNIGTLILMALPPSIILVLSKDARNIPAFFIGIIKKGAGYEIKDYFSDVYSYFSAISFNSFWGFLLWCLGILLLIVCMGMLFSSVEKKMRLGVSAGVKWLDMINDSVMLLLPYVGVVLLGYEVAGLLCSGFAALIFAVFRSGIAMLTVGLAFTVAIYGFYAVLFSYISLTVPCMMSDGYSFRYAAAYSVSLVQKENKRVIISVVMPYAVCVMILAAVTGILAGTNSSEELTEAVTKIVTFVEMVFYLMYFPVVSMRNYMLLTGGKRRDLWNWR